MKKLLDKIGLLPNRDLTHQEIQEWQENEAQTLLIIKARWVFLFMLALYGSLVCLIFESTGFAYSFKAHILPSVVALVVMMGYNAWYHYSYRWFSHICWLNQAQLVVDALYILLFIHFTQGVISWYWVMYPLIIIEAAIVIEKRATVFFLVAFCSFIYGALLLVERAELLPAFYTPFFPDGVEFSYHYLIVFWLWVLFFNLYFAFVANYLVRLIRKKEKLCSIQALTDPLTKVYNRSYFFQNLETELARCKRYGRVLSLLLIDLDSFKQFNDTYGHLAGDELLMGVVDVFKKNIRNVDILCRYGGDEFALVLPETPTGEGEILAEQLREHFESQVVVCVAERLRRQVEALKRGITISIGIASYPVHGSDVKTLLHASDEALYKAKELGRNKVVLAESC